MTSCSLHGHLEDAVVVSDGVLGHVHLVDNFGERDEEVGQGRLTDVVVVRQTTTLAGALTLDRLVVTHVVELFVSAPV